MVLRLNRHGAAVHPPRLHLVGRVLVVLMLVSLAAGIRFVQFMGSNGAELLEALASEDLRLASPWFHSTSWSALVYGESNWGPIELRYNEGGAFCIPDESLRGPRTLTRGDTSRFYVVKGDGLYVTLYVTYPVPQWRVDGLLRRLLTGESRRMTLWNRFRYYAQAVCSINAAYFGGIRRWWEEGQFLFLAFVPFQLIQQAVMLLWLPVWTLLPANAAAFVASWLTLVAVLTAFGVRLSRRARDLSGPTGVTPSRTPRTPPSSPARSGR